ncbi:MAG: tRNA lysidine(34) synthetase TilS [Hyphomonas sp.]|nr:tRNA lysidine(34) synthetase TilS [Hyphomonas sp.]
MRQLEAPALPGHLTETLDRLCSLAAGPVGVAVSGGGDSLALMALAADWGRARGREMLALTVDHRLRPESAGEAEFVAATARRLDIPHRTLEWDTPVARQSAARTARHALLAAAAEEAGSRLVLTAHTEDDQAETFLMRARAGSGWYGLAGIQPVAVTPTTGPGSDTLLLRPLLQVSRSALRLDLAGRELHWIEDPSNDNPAFERVRMRRLLRDNPELMPRILGCQRCLQGVRALTDGALWRWLGTVSCGPEGALETDTALPGGETGPRALSLLIQTAALRARPPRQDALARLARRLAAPRPFRPATLGGAVISREAGRLRLVAEHPLAPDMVKAVPARLAAVRTACSGGRD